MAASFIPFFMYCEEHDFEDRICPSCGEHVRTADGPFSERNEDGSWDETKTVADVLHWEEMHS